MPRITPDLMMSLVTKDGRLQVGTSIPKAVSACLVSDSDDIRREGDELKAEYKAAETEREPVVMDYSGSERIDAYCVYYLPRNTLVPKLALLCCSHHPELRDFDDELNVLDIGSGTGAVSLGLLDLFENDELSASQIHILAIDSNGEALERQEELVEHMDASITTIETKIVDLEDPSSYKRKLKSSAPYDMIFAANVLAELSGDGAEALLEDVSELLVPGGIIVNMESETNYAKLQRARVARKAGDLGLYRYYPCSPDAPCPKRGHSKGCWVWREDGLQCAGIRVGRETLQPTEILRAHLMILCTEPYSIYDVLEKHNPDLIWGLVESRYGEKDTDEDGLVTEDYSLCTRQGARKVRQTRRKRLIRGGDAIPRGVFIGFTPDFKETHTWDIL